MKNFNKKGLGFYRAIIKSNDVNLCDCYASYSYGKEKAYNYCKSEYCKDNQKWTNVFGFRIISYNTFHFSVAYFVENENEQYLKVITPTQDRLFLVGKMVNGKFLTIDEYYKNKGGEL